MINYVEKGGAMHVAIGAAGHWLAQVDGVWKSSNDVAVQAIIDAFDPLPEARERVWEAIKVERDRRQVMGVKVGENSYHSDEKSRIQQLGLVIMGASIPANLKWKTFNGAFVTMTPALANQVFAATAASDQAIFAAAEAHRAAMMLAPDPDKYDFSTGWPAV